MQRAAIRCTLLRRHVLAVRLGDCRLRAADALPLPNNVINGIPGRPLDATAPFHAASPAPPSQATTRLAKMHWCKIKNVKYPKNGKQEVQSLSAGECE